ncbi:MAG: alpha/beta fold hydrolase [Gammaproteobacteria bacterium]|nr:alpha/beta fold hydrolase [Gammaproteobacteria bacterium]
MNKARRRLISVTSALGAGFAILVLMVCCNGCSSGPPLEVWHTERLSEEFTGQLAEDEVNDFRKYQALEDELYKQLDLKVYASTDVGPEQVLNRYSAGSAADPRGRQPDWNRSFELEGNGSGAVLLLHGMSDSPYSLRALGQSLNRRGFHVVGLRLPGHGTAPSGLRYIGWQDMAAAVKLAMAHLGSTAGPGSKGVHIMGYSTGASLALDFTLKALDDASIPVPASLVLISPAIRVHGAARLAGFKDGLSATPGLGSLAWLNVMDEFDPYKYNSFATNAGTQVHRVTVDVDRRIGALSGSPEKAGRFPPVLVFKSTVDSTVTTDAVVDNLLKRLSTGPNELVLFDINRQAAIKSTLLVSDPGPLTNRLLEETDLPFGITFVTNENPNSSAVAVKFKAPFSPQTTGVQPLGLSWPRGVVSLSHVALTIPPDDPLYGQFPPANDAGIFLGDIALRGERGLLRIPEDWLLRMRYNPFYSYLEQRTIDWMESVEGDSSQ